MIWPLLSSIPISASAWFKRSNKTSTSLCSSRIHERPIRYAHRGRCLPIQLPKNRMNDRRSVTWYCSRSSDKPCRRCRMSILNMDAAYGLASSLAFTFFGVNALKDGAEYRPVDDGIESLQWISSLAQSGVAVLRSKRLFFIGRLSVLAQTM